MTRLFFKPLVVALRSWLCKSTRFRSSNLLQSKRCLLWSAVVVMGHSFAWPLMADQWGDFDVMARYSFMEINEVKVAGETRTPTFYRENTSVEFGWKQATLGLIYQKTHKPASVVPGVGEEGLMLTGGYDWILNDFMRLESYARIGMSPDNNPGQPLYATDTDVRLNAVFFDTEGFGYALGSSFFPSAYVGTVINRYGRVQAIGGGGLWWNKFGGYVTAFYAFNGVADPDNPGSQGDIKFANIKNAGVSFALSYEIPISTVGELMLEGRRNIPIENAGNDLVANIQYRHFFGGTQ